MVEAVGDEVDPKKVPPDISDFPPIVHIAFDVFNALSDNLVSLGMGGIIFTGKDYGNFTMIADLLLVSPEERLELFKIVSFLDARAKAKAIKDASKKSKK